MMNSTTTESHEEYVNSPVLLSMRILTSWLVYNDEQCVKTPINVLCYLLEKRKKRYVVHKDTIKSYATGTSLDDKNSIYKNTVRSLYLSTISMLFQVTAHKAICNHMFRYTKTNNLYLSISITKGMSCNAKTETAAS